MSQKNFFTLSAITNRIQEILQPAIGKRFWVKAEISSGRERTGSFYCDLVETDQNGNVLAQLRAHIWNRDLARIRGQFKSLDLDLKLENGTVAGFHCALLYTPKYGLSLQIVDADPAFALGEMELKKKQILNRLFQEGLFELNKLRHVPILPYRIGLITSVGSAAYNDFIKTLNHSCFGFKIYTADASVQGNQTEPSVLRALDALERLNVDIVVLIRGGGSKTDLFYLDNEAIARRIASCKIPVWTGIGHEIDISVLDHVSNSHFKTPTAVGDTIVARFVEMKSHLDQSKHRLKVTWAHRLEVDRKKITQAGNTMIQQAQHLLHSTRQNLRYSAKVLSSSVSTRLITEKTHLESSRKFLTSTPLPLISRHAEVLTERKTRFTGNAYKKIVDAQKGIEQLRNRFQLGRFIQKLDLEQRMVKSFMEQLKRKFTTELSIHKQQLDYRLGSFRKERVLSRIAAEKTQIQTKYYTLKASDPETNLKRGFSLVYGEKGNLIKSISDVDIKSEIRMELYDGHVISTAEKIERKHS
jgi:exodeoxyribonuclease VII large subunit